MESDCSADLTKENDSRSLIQLEGILQQEEAALAELERLVAGQRSVLISQPPTSLLEMMQSIEEVLGRIRQLETARERLAGQMAADADGRPGISLSMAARATDLSASARLSIIRHRMLGTIARIAGHNEANGQLAAGLTRVASAAIERLMQLQEANTPGPSPALNDKREYRRPATLDVQA